MKKMLLNIYSSEDEKNRNKPSTGDYYCEAALHQSSFCKPLFKWAITQVYVTVWSCRLLMRVLLSHASNL